jgi:hypothetical protein
MGHREPDLVFPETAAGQKPIYGSPQTGLKVNFHFIFKDFSGLRNVCQGMAYVPGPGSGINRPVTVPQRPTENSVELIQVKSFTAGYVEDFSRGRAIVAGHKVSPDYVIYVGKIPGLAAVPENSRPLLFDQGGDELGYDGRIVRIRVLPRPKNIEIAQADGVQSVEIKE